MLNADLAEEVPALIEDANFAWRTGGGGDVLMLRATALGLARAQETFGSVPATTPAVMVTYVMGSTGLTLKRSDDISRMVTKATTKPHAIPMTVSHNPWRTNIVVKVCLCAPSAMRMPISRVRCDTE